MRAACRLYILLLATLVAWPLAAEVSPALRDTAARIDYGFYTGDAKLVEAAREAIDASGDSAWSSYLRAYAAYRQAQLMVDTDRPAGELLDSCLNEAEDAAESSEAAVEATILIAACSALAVSDQPVRAVLHQRRYRRAADRIAAIEPDNPRFLLIAMTSGQGADSVQSLEIDSVLHAFRVRAESFAFPDWGEAEALTAAGAVSLAAGDRRSARDLVEAALLTAPDYIEARHLAARISSISTTR